MRGNWILCRNQAMPPKPSFNGNEAIFSNGTEGKQMTILL
jgi:hypothetical protein